MILSTLQISTTLTWGAKGAFALQIYIFPFCVKGFGEDCSTTMTNILRNSSTVSEKY